MAIALERRKNCDEILISGGCSPAIHARLDVEGARGATPMDQAKILVVPADGM
jgi:hypothetical protein